MTEFIAQCRKAITGAVAGAATCIIAVAPDGITGEEWGKVGLAALVGGVAVWAVPNKSTE